MIRGSTRGTWIDAASDDFLTTDRAEQPELNLRTPPLTHTMDLALILREFGGKHCLDCQKCFNEDDLDHDGRCADCRRRAEARLLQAQSETFVQNDSR